ncbi:hypothetical protein QZH41_020656, partial [Actinostola sp. cb2023]
MSSSPTFVVIKVSTDSLPVIDATSVEVGFLWEHPRQENHHSAEVVINTQHLKSVLRLICFISPPLPDKYEDQKNAIVRWDKVTTRRAKPVDGIRFWADDRATMAISLDNVTYDIIGTYTCSYGQLSKSISVKVANVDIVKKLKMPSSFEEVKNYATHIHDTTGIKGWNQQLSFLQGKGRSFTCEKFVKASKTPPTTIHKIHPSDVQVIAAVGDGFTSGLGAKIVSWNGFFTDYRGMSWSIGGERHLNDTTTLPNILREFSPQLNGFSTETSMSDLNKANSSAPSGDLEDQVRSLILEMKNNKVKDIEYQNDWKVLTIWTGMVDLCHICQDPEKFSSGNFIKNVMHSLNILKKEVPRLYVNMVPPLDVSILHGLFNRNPTCQILEWNACPCAATQDKESRNRVSKAANKYMSLLEELVNSGIYNVTDQFTVVIQPFVNKGPINKNGQLAEDLFGPDCLHFNVKGHAAAAVALWNSMLEPLHSKSTDWNVDQKLSCPSQ